MTTKLCTHLHPHDVRLATRTPQMAKHAIQMIQSSAAMTQSLPDIRGLTIAAPWPGKTGNVQQAHISLKSTPFKLIVGSTEKPVRVPFDLKPFIVSDISTMLYLHLTVTEPTCEQYGPCLGAHLLKNVAASSTDLFDKWLSPVHIHILNKAVLQPNEAYDSSVTCIVNMQMPRQLRVWNEDKDQVGLPVEWKTHNVVAAMTAEARYVVSNMFGSILEATDVRSCEQNGAMAVCRFFGQWPCRRTSLLAENCVQCEAGAMRTQKQSHAEHADLYQHGEAMDVTSTGQTARPP